MLRITEAQPKAQVTKEKDIALMSPGRHRVEGQQGLYLYVSPDGNVRRWIFRYTSPVTRRVTETGLDLAAHVSLTQAKTKAHDLRRQIAAGVCPIHAKRAERASTVTFKQAADGWIATHKSSWKPGVNGKDGAQMRNAMLLLYAHGAPLAKVPVANVTPDMVEAALKDLWARAPNQGRRTLAMWSRILNFARAKGWRAADNAADWKGNMEYRFARQRASDRGHHAALPYEEMPGFMRALRQKQIRSISASCLEFVILTAARTGEVTGMRWEEIDWNKKLWVVPAERMKGGKAHEVR